MIILLRHTLFLERSKGSPTKATETFAFASSIPFGRGAYHMFIFTQLRPVLDHDY